MTPRDAIWQVLAQIQAQSANEPQPDFRVEAELPSAATIMAEAAARDPFRMERLVSMEKPSQPKVDWKVAAMLASDSQRRLQQAAATIGPTQGGVALPSERPNPLAGIPMGVQRDNPLAGIAMPGVSRQPIEMGWRTPQAVADRAMAGAQEQFDAQTPVLNTAIRMGLPAVTGAAGAFAGGPLGAAVGGAMGATVAEHLAQNRETAQGTRVGANPAEIYMAGLTAMPPMANLTPTKALLPQLPKVAGSALGVGAAASTGMQLAETGTVDPSRLVRDTLVTGALGTGMAAGAGALAKGADSAAVANLMADETGAIGPDIRMALPQQPEAAPGGLVPTRVAMPDAQAATSEGRAKPLPPLRDSYSREMERDLSEFGDTLYRESSLEDALGYYLPGSPSRRRQPETFFANTPELALGQGNNTGVLFEFDSRGIKGIPNTWKAGWDFQYGQGNVELVSRYVPNEDLVSRVKAVTLRPAQVAQGVEGRLSRRDRQMVLARLEREGFTQRETLQDGSLRFTRPAAPSGRAGLEPAPLPQAPDVPTDVGVTRFKKLPASERGVLDRVPVPESMGPSGFTEAEKRADRIRYETALRRNNPTPEAEALGVEIFDAGAQYWKQRGMHTTWGQTIAEASRVIPDPKLPKGTILNAADMTALRASVAGLLARTADITTDLVEARGLNVAATNGDAAATEALSTILNRWNVKSVGELRLKQEQYHLEAQYGQKSLEASKSEVGRSLNMLKAHINARNMNDAEYLTKVIERGGVGSEALEILASLKRSDGTYDREAQFKYLHSLTKPGAQEYWHWYARTAYLSSMATQWRNLAGNASNFGIEALAVRPVAAAMDSVVNPNNRSVTMPELRAMGTTSGFLDGLHKASYFFKNGFTQDDVDALENLPPEVFDGKLFPNVIARTMGAVDQFFRTVGFHVELHRMAITEAHNKGLRGQAMLDYAKQIVDDPTITPDLVKKAEKYAAGLTFQDAQYNKYARKAVNVAHTVTKFPDELTKGFADFAWENGLNKWGKAGAATYGLLSFPPSVIIAPFINTPFNIVKRAAQFTPFALPAMKGAEGNRDRVMMAARGAVGTAMMGAAVGLWMNGRITGKPPAYGTPEWETFYATKKPNSILIGGQWVPYSYLGPVGMVLAATVNYAEAVSKDPRNVLGWFGNLVGSVGSTLTDATFLRGMQHILMAIADDTPEKRYAQKFANSTVTGLLPLAGAQRDIRNLIDPVLRDPVTTTDMKGVEPQTWRDHLEWSVAPIKEQIMAATPGLSQKLEPRLNATGEEIQRPSSVLPESRQDDPVRQELLRLKSQESKGGYYRDPVEAGRSLLGKINTDIEAQNKRDGQNRPLLASVPRPLITEYAKQYGQRSEQLLTWLMNTDRYKAATDEQRRQGVDEVKRAVTRELDDAFKRRYFDRAVRKR